MAYHNTQDFFQASADHCQCFWQKWIPDQPIERTVIIQHGLGEHSGRYENLLDYFAGSSTAFYAMDARGHGRSEGKKGHVKLFMQYADDLHDFVKLVLQEQKVNEVFLLGHSLGGAIAALYASAYPQHLRGLILSSPAIELYMTPYMKVAKATARGLAAAFPSLTLASNLNQKYLSHDRQVIADYRADPLVHGYASATLGYEMFRVGEKLYNKAPSLHMPLYIMHGTGDKITDAKGSEKFYELAGSQDKTLKLYDDLYHEMMNEPSKDREVVLEDLKAWILAH